MNWVDWAIIAIIGVSTLFSLLRGFVREALSLAAWAAAFLISFTFGAQLAGLLVDQILHPEVRYAVACLTLFVGTLVVGMLVNSLAGSIVKMAGLGAADRFLGTIFGFARGAIVVMVVLFTLVKVLPPEQQGMLDESRLMPHLLMVVQWAESNFSSLVGGGNISWDT